MSFIMSLFFTGTGEIYSGSAQKGFILALLRIASALAIPFYSITCIKDSYLTEVLFSVLFFSLITIYSPFSAFLASYKKKKVVVSKLSSVRFIVIFIICNFILTSISAAVFFTFFSIKASCENYPPLIENGDFIVVKRIGNQFYTKGEMVILNDKNINIVRIIARPDESVSYRKDRFLIQGSELFQSIFTDNELKQFSLTDLDVISETGGSFRYPVIQNRDKYDMNITLKSDEYFSAPDDRNNTSGFMAVKKENVFGRIEGILFSKKKFKLLIKPFLNSL